jgi:hypothetical protein
MTASFTEEGSETVTARMGKDIFGPGAGRTRGDRDAFAPSDAAPVRRVVALRDCNRRPVATWQGAPALLGLAMPVTRHPGRPRRKSPCQT